jgi:Fur family ferric uptake transcriptional regulator
MRRAGLRCTGPRLQAVRELARLPRHFGAEEALAAVNAGESRLSVSRATLYRLLGQLERLGVLRRVLLSEGHSHYEFVGERQEHSHVVCSGCGRVAELRSAELERAVSRLCAERGFSTEHLGVEISVARCERCAVAETVAPAASGDSEEVDPQ